jgi:uncharacterized protein
MLIEFRVSNFKSFKDEQVLSMVASSDDSLPDNIFQIEEKSKLRLLRSVVIYGANASGKSKLLEALNLMCSFVIDSVNEQPDATIDVEPFLFDKESASAPSEFEVTFIHNEIRYQYGFSANSKRILKEYLYATPKGRTVPYFQRNWNAENGEDDYFFGASLKGYNEIIKQLVRNNALFLSYAAALNHPILSEVYKWFARPIFVFQNDRRRSRILVSDLKQVESQDVHKRIQELLKFADLGVSDFQYKEVGDYPYPLSASGVTNVASDKAETERLRWAEVELLHPSTDQELIPLALVKESRGTQQLFYLSRTLLKALVEGKIVLADELERSLHPLLVRSLIQLFNNPKTNICNAQLIFNTHDTTLLDQTFFRRDQIWFTEKDAGGASHLYSMLEFSPRKGESLAKGYLQGRYGAIPFLSNPNLILTVENHE